jgi:tetratricopeptide (TPR) repeat protein
MQILPSRKHSSTVEMATSFRGGGLGVPQDAAPKPQICFNPCKTQNPNPKPQTPNQVWHNKGLCLSYLKRLDEAQEAFMRANSVQRHDCTFLQLGHFFTQQEDYKSAIDVYLEALEFSPESPELLTTIGLLYLRLGENFRAFDFLGNSLTHDPRNPKTILAAGSIIQVTNPD